MQKAVVKLPTKNATTMLVEIISQACVGSHGGRYTKMTTEPSTVIEVNLGPTPTHTAGPPAEAETATTRTVHLVAEAHSTTTANAHQETAQNIFNPQ